MKKNRAFAGILIMILIIITGCGKKSETNTPLKKTGLKLNTMIDITLYDNKKEEILDKAFELCDFYENIYSRTLETSELYKLNHRLLNKVEGTKDAYYVSDELEDLLLYGMKYSKLSKGAFDITVAPVSSLWDFTSGEDKVPSKEEIKKNISYVDYTQFSIENNIATFKNPNVTIDLGAIAKGYIADRIKDLLISEGVTSAIINLGGNVLCVGNKYVDDGIKDDFHIGIQKPFADRNEIVSIMDINDKSVVSSGIYERSFTKDGKFYHHLLDTDTGYPLDNGLIAVTIISDKSVDGDGLSTSTFALGLEDGMKLIESIPDTYAIFITEDYQIHYTEGFLENINVEPAD